MKPKSSQRKLAGSSKWIHLSVCCHREKITYREFDVPDFRLFQKPGRFLCCLGGFSWAGTVVK